MTDQRRWDTVGAYGSPMDLTPNIETLASTGVRFDRAVTPKPVCGASRAIIQISSEIRRAIRTNRWKLAVSAPTKNGWRGGKEEKSSDRYVERYPYDLLRDPHEQVNLAGRPEYRSVFNRLYDRIETYIEDIEGEPPDIVPFASGYQDY